MTIIDAIGITLKVLDSVEVRGSHNLRALSTAMNNLEEIIKAIAKVGEKQDDIDREEYEIPVNVHVVTHEEDPKE